MNKNSITLVAACLFLGACSSMNSSFSCGVGDGLGCQSLGQVNQAVNQGYGQPNSSSNATNGPVKLDFVAQYEFSAVPTRHKEQWLQVWLPPYIDEQNHYVGERTLYTVIKPAMWSHKDEDE